MDFFPLVSEMTKRGQDGCLFHYNRIASVSLHGVCFPTRLWAPGRWDRDSGWLDIIASHLALHHMQWVLHEGWLNTCVNEWMDVLNTQANPKPSSSLSRSPLTSLPIQAAPPKGLDLVESLEALLSRRSWERQRFCTVPAPEGAVGCEIPAWGLTRNLSISIKH